MARGWRRASSTPAPIRLLLPRAGSRHLRTTAVSIFSNGKELRDVAAQQSKALPRLRETGSINRVRFAIAAVDLARVGADRGPDLARHDDRAFDVRRVDLQISDQRLGKTLYGKFRGRIGGMRD